MLFGALGMQMYGNRQIAYVRDDKEKLAKTFWSLYSVQLATSTVSLIAYYLFIGCFTNSNTTIFNTRIKYNFSYDRYIMVIYGA